MLSTITLFLLSMFSFKYRSHQRTFRVTPVLVTVSSIIQSKDTVTETDPGVPLPVLLSRLFVGQDLDTLEIP